MLKLFEFGFSCTVVMPHEMWSYWMRDTVGAGGGNCGDAGVGTSFFKVGLNCWLQEQGGFSLWPENEGANCRLKTTCWYYSVS